MNRFLVKDPDVGWVSVESEGVIPRDNKQWRYKLDQMIAEMKFKETYSFSMEFKGETYLAMIRPGMERVNGETDVKPHNSDYQADRWNSYSKSLFPRNAEEEAALKFEAASERKQALLKFAS